MEPTDARVRPIHMGRTLRAAVVAGACALTLAGCGSKSPDAHGAESSGSTAVGKCDADSTVVKEARTVASADVDGDGKVDSVKLTGSSGDCPYRLFAKVSDGFVSAGVPTVTGAVMNVFGVTLEGHDGALLVTRQDLPRGGYQLHVFARDGAKLSELMDGDQPLVPFVATDVRPISATVDCRGGTIVVNQAVAGSGGAWDVRRTTYAVDGSTATKSGTSLAARKVTPKQVDQLMPAGAAVFPSCRA